ncbi:phosphatase PAP2 family protein [Ignavibacteria bacterium]|nr:phosphatase PAP2 family protein [Bacteroidota bacterium]MCZ2133366.1 phosphatase PAP2 family protein [Bacteroidota bacterium]
MLDLLLQTDISLFRFINGSLANPVFDAVMPIVTESKYWMPVYAALFIWLLWKRRREGAVICLILALGAVIGDQFNSMWLKEWVGRIRPCHALEGVRLVGVWCGSGKSFPSSHAVNNFAAATLLGYFYPNRRAIWYSIATTVAFSRVYVGVHYPFDVASGAALGASIAFVLIVLQQFAAQKNNAFSVVRIKTATITKSES